jgi:hypothetical protein
MTVDIQFIKKKNSGYTLDTLIQKLCREKKKHLFMGGLNIECFSSKNKINMEVGMFKAF